MKSFPGAGRVALAVALMMNVLDAGALAQTNGDRSGVTVREVAVSTGYTDVQLPPITLGGYLPLDVLSEDLITSASVAIDWKHLTPRTRYRLDLAGSYTGRTRYSELNSPATDLRFGISRSIGHRWLLGAGVANAIASSDQLALQPNPARRLVDQAASFDDLAGAVTYPRSPHPDPIQAALFVPISQSLDAGDLSGNRLVASSARTEATYLNSPRLATSFRGSYAAIRWISRDHDAGHGLPPPDSTAASAGVGVRYDRTERTQLTAAVDWSQTSGTFEDKALLATAGYGWSGRKWFTMISLGVALRPFRAPAADPSLPAGPSREPALISRVAVGYKFRTQTLLVQYSHAPHDEYGYGGSNVATGFVGNVQSVVGAWSWTPASRWLARSDISMIRRPGNFSYINAWLVTAGIGRELGPHVRLMGEALFDRHGSRGFEGFHLTRQGARLTLVWTPSRRPVRPADSDD